MDAATCVVYCACPDDECARSIARALVEERLAACVSRVPGVTSTYVWDGAVQEDSEVLLVIKTTQAALPALQARIETLHPYELPEVVAVPINGGSAGYLEWLRNQASARS